jgi:UDP-N-acetyl-D-mannosaminuronic acid dehydrogenase
LVRLDEALAADVILLLTDHQEFRAIDPRRLGGKRIIDTRGTWHGRRA